MEQGGIQAQVPVAVIEKEPGEAAFGAGSTADALVVMKSFASILDIDAFCEVRCFLSRSFLLGKLQQFSAHVVALCSGSLPSS